MQERNRIRLIVDIVLTILFIALLYAENTGFTFHEIAGLAMVLCLFTILYSIGHGSKALAKICSTPV